MFAEVTQPLIDPMILLQQGGVAAAFVVMWWLERRSAAKERIYRDDLTAKALELNQVNGELIKLVERHSETTARLAESTARIHDLLATLAAELRTANRQTIKTNVA